LFLHFCKFCGEEVYKKIVSGDQYPLNLPPTFRKTMIVIM
jgi:hypothetical protein